MTPADAPSPARSRGSAGPRRGHVVPAWPQRLAFSGAGRRAWIAAGLVFAAILLGGGGSPAPATELALQAVALAALIAWSFAGGDDTLAASPQLKILAALVVVLPLAHLVPLPPGLWHRLPGREAEVAALALVGRADAWMPLSLSPPRTLAALLSLIPPLVVLMMVGRLRRPGRRLVLAAIAAGGAASVLLGVVQLAGGDDSWAHLYDKVHSGFLHGFQANRNAEADVLLIALAAVAALAGPLAAAAPRVRVGLTAAVVALLLAVVLTGSRFGIALIAVGLSGAALLGRWWEALPHERARRRRLLAGAALAIAAVGATGWLLRDQGRLADVWGRFATVGEARPGLWEDGWYAAQQVWPAGAGMAAFVPVFLQSERLEMIDTTFPNRAHNDFLELLVEAGLPGVAVLTAVFALLAWRAVRGLQAPGAADRGEALFASTTLVVLTLHSVLDYPLRSLTLACLAAVAAALLMPGRALQPPYHSGSSTS